MELLESMIFLQTKLFFLILTGIIIKKLGFLTERGRKELSDLLIMLILPCNIITSFISELTISSDFIRNCALAVLISAIIQLTATVGGQFLFRHEPRARRSVLAYGMICSNSSFVGLPVAENLYGAIGVLYTSIFQIPVRFTMWTAGLSLFTEVNGLDALKRLLRHPCIVSIFLGFGLMVLPISLPEVLSDTVSTVSKCTIPISMLVIGSILADADIKTLFSRSVLYFSLWRLLLYPLLFYLLLRPLALDKTLFAICILMTGMPAGSTLSILADKYDGDALFASQITFVTTFGSIFTIPLLTLLL